MQMCCWIVELNYLTLVTLCSKLLDYILLKSGSISELYFT